MLIQPVSSNKIYLARKTNTTSTVRVRQHFRPGPLPAEDCNRLSASISVWIFFWADCKALHI